VALAIASLFPDLQLHSKAALVVFLPVFAALLCGLLIRDHPDDRRFPKRKAGETWQETYDAQRRRRAQFEADLPRWVQNARRWVIAYAFLTIAISFWATRTGVAAQYDGAYFAKRRGEPGTPISKEEYWRLTRHELRGISAFGIAFGHMPAIWFYWALRRARNAERVSDDQEAG
jgi:hypothetical protein